MTSLLSSSSYFEGLMDEVDALLLDHPDEPPCPDLPLPPDDAETDPFSRMELREDDLKGRGWYATQEIPVGTLLLCEKPIGMVMDWEEPVPEQEVIEEDEEEDNEEDEKDEEQLALCKLHQLLQVVLLKKIQSDVSVWEDKISNLFPRTKDEIETLQPYQDQDQQPDDQNTDEISIEANALLRRIPEPVRDDVGVRLPLILRYNVLSAETSPELLVYPSVQGYAALAGTALYHHASFFNHDSKPNASRYCVGDVLFVVANQTIRAGDPVCISYLEHDVLCEPPANRTALLGMDFAETMQDQAEPHGPLVPVVDTLVQNELMQMEPHERLRTIDSLMAQAKGEAGPEEQQQPHKPAGSIPEGEEYQEEDDVETEEEEENEPWFQVDVHNLNILKALTLDALNKPNEAKLIWDQCIQFCETCLPPVDEATVVMHVQAALCCQACGDHTAAAHHAAKALDIHNTIFGGGLRRFRRRYQREFRLALRPENEDGSGPDTLWPPQA